MARIRCSYEDCIFLDDGYCSAAAIELDPEMGCLTYRAIGEVGQDEDLYENELLDELDLDDLGVDDMLLDDDPWDGGGP